MPRPCIHRRLGGVGLLLVVGACATTATQPARYVRFAEARGILADLAGRLPPELSPSDGSNRASQQEAAWPGWIERHDRDVRARLDQGDEDTIVNWLLFGTSFTAQPRAILGAVEGTTDADRSAVVQRTIQLIGARMDDLISALSAPGTDERRLFARALLERKGLSLESAAGQDAVRERLLGTIMRVAQEQEQIDQALAATSRQGDSIGEFVARSSLFRTRGLSLDTSVLPNYAIEQSLAAMKQRGLVKAGELKRVAIVGPGLDFADKDVGFDFYPQQTVQPFAAVDSIKRLGLAPSGADPEMVLLDISPRVLDHVARARERAARGEAYTLHLPLPKSTPWEPDVRKYWETFGDRIGLPAQAATSQAILEQAELRAVRVDPAVVQRMSAADLNIVTQRVDGEAFDLVIATNVFIYYDVLEQALAMTNIEAMLKPGGFLLANVAAPPIGSLTIRPIDTHTTVYGPGDSQAEGILDYMVWYQARTN